MKREEYEASRQFGSYLEESPIDIKQIFTVADGAVRVGLAQSDAHDGRWRDEEQNKTASIASPLSSPQTPILLRHCSSFRPPSHLPRSPTRVRVSSSRVGKMGQQTLIYSFVARGTVILVEYTAFTGNFTSVASQCLQKLPSSNNRFTYNCDGHTFNYLVENGFTYCVVAVESAGKQTPMALLERVKEDFSKKYGAKAATATANGLNREFKSKLKEHMQFCIDHPEEINKIAKVKAQVSEVKGVMMENIEKVLERGEKIELLVDKTEDLRSQAQDFRQQGTKLKRKMWVDNMKIKLAVFGIIGLLILLIILSICPGFRCF
ncbi:hypothetical protein ZIOFF_059000 [Zingiber officinale]|uniref:Vesicle-associated membrane protein 726 n=2 Tax=Zingiber officinale TaxID=94328 RepID=A0A8J5F8R1_ZINOF|nr:hypothetical protein ZIOFF_059000 [Zingiber officinale]